MSLAASELIQTTAVMVAAYALLTLLALALKAEAAAEKPGNKSPKP